MFCLFGLLAQHTGALDMVGWYIYNITPRMAPEKVPWKYYTHIVVGEPIVSKTNGTAFCNKNDTEFPAFVSLAKQYKRKVVWRSGLQGKAVWQLLANESWSTYRSNYLSTIGQAVRDCQVDGIEFDYECPPTPLGRAGIVTDEEATQFTQFMVDVKKAMGPDKQISCDMGVWGVTQGSYPFMFKPWVNVSMVKAGAIDYINTMSYHYPFWGTEVFPWQKDAFILTELWGLPKDRINLGLPYFFHNGTREPLWSELSPLCPNIAPDATHCQGVHICGKDINYAVGKFIKEKGFRGAFPWAANFDTVELNNSLAEWLYRGLTE